VETLQPVASAQQETRTSGLSESFMREWHSVRINLAHYELPASFPHSQKRYLTLDWATAACGTSATWRDTGTRAAFNPEADMGDRVRTGSL
jgi:hypothetical protein